MNTTELKNKFAQFMEIIKELGIREIEKGNVADDPIKHALMVINSINKEITNEEDEGDFPVFNQTPQ